MGSEGGRGGMCEKKKNGEIFWGGGKMDANGSRRMEMMLEKYSCLVSVRRI